MGDILVSIYPWAKSLHIISVISWMAGLLYLPRLFVYHSSTNSSDVSEQFKIMEYKLFRFIMNPAMMSSWLFGILLFLTPGIVGLIGSFWFLVKFALVLAMTGSHVWMGRRVRDFAADRNRLSSRTYRFVNEVPTVLMIIIVILVVVKPF